VHLVGFIIKKKDIETTLCLCFYIFFSGVKKWSKENWKTSDLSFYNLI